MSTKRLAPEALIELAIETLRAEIAPDLAADKRYTLAMVTNALEIARRDVITEGEGDDWVLLDELYDDGEGSFEALAADIRRGAIDDSSKPGLRGKLRRHVVEELKIKNPRFLKSRGVG